jgi:hypothetical protein
MKLIQQALPSPSGEREKYQSLFLRERYISEDRGRGNGKMKNKHRFFLKKGIIFLKN